MRIKISLFLAALAFLSLPALGQQGNSEVSANFTGNFQKQASGFGLTDSSTYSGGFLINYRYHFNRWSAIEANYGNTLFSQIYTSGSVTQARVQEATFAYQFTFGVDSEARFHPFLEAGTGALFFSPVLAGSSGGGVSQNRGTFLYGAGVTYKLVRNFSVQAGYRGLVYTAPDFALPTQVTNAKTQMAEPYVGLTYRF
ncbi:MAG: outer membrane beta-barrel protein [Candidatus Acidiferrales bacterium]